MTGGSVKRADRADPLDCHRRWLRFTYLQSLIVMLTLIVGMSMASDAIPYDSTPVYLAAFSIPALGLAAWVATHIGHRLQRPVPVFLNLWLGALAVVWAAIAIVSHVNPWLYFSMVWLSLTAVNLGVLGISLSLREEARNRSPNLA